MATSRRVSAAPSTRENVKVVCRVRPQNSKEVNAGGSLCTKLSPDQTAIEIGTEEGISNYTFDRVYGPESTQQSVFEFCAIPLVRDVLTGYNATIFAYGQTGTGKTHTMEGNIHSEKLKGIIPRAVEALFEGVGEADENIEFTFKVSYVEIYMEKIRDLLDDTRLKNNLTVREDKVKGIYIAGVTEDYVTSHEELLDIMGKGANNRATAATGMNEGSSRSHSVFTITVGQRDVSTNVKKSGKLVLVDLAGSEMVRKTNASGQQLEEAKTINKSLSALGQVINALSSKETITHIPYRDSKLTRILQDSLGGNSKTVLVIAISPSSYNLQETLSTIRFGTRAKSIENKVTMNQTRSMEELESLLTRAEKAIDAQSAHINSLTAQLTTLQQASTISTVSNNEEDPEEEEEESGSVSAAASRQEELLLLEAKRAEAEAAIINMYEEKLTTLLLELEEEREESQRKDDENLKLAQRLKDKEHLLQEAGELLMEAQHHNESHRERAEVLVREKSIITGELESLKSRYQDDIEKSNFELRELEATVDTLREQNKQLSKEIAEISGDSMELGSEGMKTIKPLPASASLPALSQSSSARNSVQDDSFIKARASDDRLNRDSIVGGRESVVARDFEADSETFKQHTGELNSIFDEYDISYDARERISTAVFDKLSQYETESQTLREKCEYYDAKKVDYSKKIKDMEAHRIRLEKDLQSQVEKIALLNIYIDSLGKSGGDDRDSLIHSRQDNQMKSLQQRLEQLVAVHRQLLRKFASVELENVEFKKKIQLRDDRIKQLEDNSKNMTGNIRQQTERHVGELASLRQMIQNLKADHQKRIETAKSHESPSQATGPRTVRGGNAFGGKGWKSPKSLTASSIEEDTEIINNNDLDELDDDPKDDTATESTSSTLTSRFPDASILGGSQQQVVTPMTSSRSSTGGIFSRFLGQK